MSLTLLWTPCLSSYQFISLFSFLETDTMLFASLFHLSFSLESSQSCFQPHHTTVTVITSKGQQRPLSCQVPWSIDVLFLLYFSATFGKADQSFFWKHFYELSFHFILLLFLLPRQLLLLSIFYLCLTSRCWNILRLSSGFPFPLFFPTGFQYHLHTEAS